LTVTVPPLLPLPDSTTQHVDDAGKPKKDLTNWLTSVQATIKSLNEAVTSLSAGTALLKANNLSDLANTGTARTNLGLGNVSTLNVNVASGVPTLNGSGQYQGFDGQLIANVQTYNVNQAPRVLTVTTAGFSGSPGPIGYGGTTSGANLGYYTYTAFTTGSCGSFSTTINVNFGAWASMPGSWQNISVQTISGNGDYGIFVRFA
jgi:hypothetical protein